MFLIGTAKSDITAFKDGYGMMGYGAVFNTMEEIETPLYTRSFVVKEKDSGHQIAFVNCEICLITPSIKRGVLQILAEKYPKLGFNDSNVLICAQHTHSGPAGYSHHVMYNITTPGFIPDVFEKITSGIVDTIVEASNNLQEGNIQYVEGEMEADKEVAFNRSLDAYNLNPEVKKYSFEERHLAVDRRMQLLRFLDKDGKDLGSINWFAVHTTSIPNNNHKVCSDNKGYASTFLEETFGADYLGIFAQGACGDVSPKFVYNPKHDFQRGKYEGKFPDDFESAKYNGKLQFEKAKELVENDNQQKISSSQIDSILTYIDFSDIEIDKRFTDGKENKYTSPSCMGASFFEGAIMDGPGMHPAVGFVARRASTLVKYYEYFIANFKSKEAKEKIHRKYKVQGKKHIVMESGERKVLGTRDIKNLVVPAIADETIRNLKIFHIRGALDDKSWTPQVLPLQILRLGSIAIVAFPFEITTVASWRLQKTLDDVLLKNGFTKVILCPYSNAYNGYVTTNEEYQLQMYEAGHTVFGEWTLAALQQSMEQLCTEFLKDKNNRTINSYKNDHEFSTDHLRACRHYRSNFAAKRKKERRLSKS